MATSGIWQSGAGYEGYVGRWSRLVAATFIDRFGVPVEAANGGAIAGRSRESGLNRVAGQLGGFDIIWREF